MTIQTVYTRVLRTPMFLLAALVASHATALAATPNIKVMTYNTHHGGMVSTPATTDGELDTIAAQDPDVVVLQEAYMSQLNYYVNGLNARLGTNAWHGVYARHCQAGSEPTCTSYRTETVMILTRLTTLAVNSRLIWARDRYHVARATIRMSVELADGTQANVFVTHLPAQTSARAARDTYVNTFQTWAQSFAGPKLVGGDFNDSPGTTPIVAMTQLYSDAWTVGGSGSGFTHMHYPSLTSTSRIDYWFSDKSTQSTLASVTVVGDPTDSDHLGVVAAYAVPSNQPNGETTLMDDHFDAFDATMWPGRVITGTRDATIPVAVTNGMLRIGSLKESTSGAHYNGISSAAYNLSSNGCAAVQLVTSLNVATTAYAMFAVTRDTNNLYRWYQSGDTLVAEKKVAGVKTALVNLQYDAIAHQFLRIRKASNAATGTEDVVFETAPNTGGVPGTFTERSRQQWDARVGPTSLKFELKAGTSVPEVSPGSAYWDNLHAAVNCR